MANTPSTAAGFKTRAFTERRLFVYAAALLVLYAVLLVRGYVSGVWLIDANGNADRTNFLVFWSAGRMVLDGNAAETYDWMALQRVEADATGNAILVLPWVYPPCFLLAVAPFALLPYVAAFFAWVLATLGAYVATVYAILSHRLAAVVACASPLVLWNFFTTQNGFLTSALIGGSLVFMNERPIMAGVCLGFLTYKPQYGLLFPFVLALTSRWRVFVAAMATALIFAGLSFVTLGGATWQAFFHSLSTTASMELSGNHLPWMNIQSAYGLARWLGAGSAIGWIAHCVVAAATTLIVSLIWMRPISYRLKAAALSTGALIVTPYVLIYDLVALAVPAAFLVAEGIVSGFRRGERTALLLIWVGFFYPMVPGDVGPLAAILVAALMALILIRIARTGESSTVMTPARRITP